MFVVRYSLFFSFVFVKQKTAYEMRISDWSSDVCSSDLIDIVNKTMKIGDDLMWKWIELLSFDIGVEEAKQLRADVAAGLNPRDVKLRLARELAARFHDATAAQTAIAGWQIGRAHV